MIDTINGYEIYHDRGKFAVRYDGVTVDRFSSMGLAAAYCEVVCPRCREDMGHSSVYGSKFCFHCRYLPERKRPE